MSWKDERFIGFNYSDSNPSRCTLGLVETDQLEKIWMPDLYIYNSMQEVSGRNANQLILPIRSLKCHLSPVDGRVRNIQY